MKYDVQDIKVSENLLRAKANARALKTGFTLFSKPNTNSLQGKINSQVNSQRPFGNNNKSKHA